MLIGNKVFEETTSLGHARARRLWRPPEGVAAKRLRAVAWWPN